MTSPLEPVYLRFRGRTRRLPLLAIAIALRRDAPSAAQALEILINGPPESLAPSDDARRLHHQSRGEGVGGGVFPECSERGAQRSETKSNDPNDERSERSGADVVDNESFARAIAIDLGDQENVGAIRKLVDRHPRLLLEQARRAALAVPGHHVRSSRGAIFTAAVRRLAGESAHSRTSSTL